MKPSLLPRQSAWRFLCGPKVSRISLRWLEWCCLPLLLLSASAQVAAPRLEILWPENANGWLRLNSTFHSNSVLTLHASANLSAWTNIGTLHNALLAYPDAASAAGGQRFYRVAAAERHATNDWKNQISYPSDPFQATNAPKSVTWVKFSILLDDPTRVYYQDSKKHLFHYDFATLRLPQFWGMSYAEFDAVSLYRTNQQVVMGAVLYPPAVTYAEYGVQFIGRDVYTPEEISNWFELVKATTYLSNSAEAYYMPTYEQSEMARTNAGGFAALGIPVASVDRWLTVNTCYSAGWALGRLKFFTAADVVAAYSDGRLQPGDILLTDGVPADTPLVAGIITLSPSTPNSHTAILSQSFGIPFVYVPNPEEQARVQSLVGHKVILRATVTSGVAEIKVLDVEGQLDPELEAQILELKVPAPINFLPKQPFGSIWTNTDFLVPTDIKHFGGKAANYGLLRRWIPTNCPVAIAFSFDLWDAFLDQTLPGGQTLRVEIATRLAPFTNYPPDVVSLKTNLAAIRDLFTKTASFTSAQQQAITNVLAGWFNPQRKIRFRSSTNVEDAEQFTGAGLYDSYSGCLLDDMDGDTAGPSHCDATDSKEKGVFLAIQKVYASFYNDDAVLERLMHRVDETQVAMGVLVHHSFPDEEELANGVATPTFTFTPSSTNVLGDIVTQLGAESVTNPDGSAVPEVVTGKRYNSISIPPTYTLTLKQYSSRVPLGDYVMDWQADYRGFLDLFTAIGCGFRQFYPTKNDFCLDFEYKKDVNLGLVVKQVRELPKASTTNSVTAFLIDEATTCSVRQAEFTSVFANHRLKSLWNLHTTNLWMTATNLGNGIYTYGSYEYPSNGTIQTLSGPLSGWPGASVSPSGSTNYWTTGAGAANSWFWRLETTLETNATGAQPPVFTQADFARKVGVTYATAMPTIDRSGVSGKVTNETVSLETQPVLTPGAILMQRTLHTNAVTVQTSFCWPERPNGILIYTAPLLQFVETRITGLTSEPIVLTNCYSQTYCPGHHNFTEEFIFEPRLDPSVPSTIINQLNAANIQLIYVCWSGGTNALMWRLGLDGRFGRL
ncbi:MAG TPA: PEP/pyruvate-binding domain-containing protein [Candidatus Paceibacterota bacterium]|nr:PEP/pyruvate-binding domain-containing protein [Verrucomicrobiota bacterium]HSA10869.1 PEP/pyruvate-binding domain-containing protein [Candidatus Paceibacterota bacterium]